MVEVTKKEIARLHWQCRRGMRELDLLMERYLHEQYVDASDDDQQSFRDLLALPDPTLFAYVTSREVPEDENMKKLVEFISVYLERHKA